MPDTADIPALQRAIQDAHGVGCRHIGSVDVNGLYPDALPWHGIVSVFQLVGHPQASTAYAWRVDGMPIAIVLAVPPVASAPDAVRAWLAQSSGS